jgi:hypothetical protein
MRDLYALQKVDGKKLTVTLHIRVPEMKSTATAPDKRALPATVLGEKGRAILFTLSDVTALTPPGFSLRRE